LTARAQIRHAATTVIWRRIDEDTQVLMGQRGATAAFMPAKFVFPGGAVDTTDHQTQASGWISDQCEARLRLHVDEQAPSPKTLVQAALRELSEETGLQMTPLQPAALRFVFRAITPPGLPRRFDARFFLCHAQGLTGDTIGFSAASGELSHLQWVGLGAARALDLPFITEIVLAEVQAILNGHIQSGVPFFDNSGTTPRFHRLQ
jgi:8-oxo-dGTP pyrophosphatase MutT (NUDIX family)